MIIYLPYCCGVVMVPIWNRDAYHCTECGTERTTFQLRNWEIPRQQWTPTVPHPLIQMDEQLRKDCA